MLLVVVGHAANPPPTAKRPKQRRSKNGVRLVGDSGPRGRLEVSSTDGWLAGYDEGAPPAWRPVCDTGFFDDSMAQVMCEMLGYRFGRKYYTPEVAFRPPNDTATWSDNPIDYMYCTSPEAGSRRIRRRDLLSPLRGSVNTPPASPYTCEFRKGDCAYTGAMAGVECADQQFPPAPPPPPSPPNPPDRPPSMQYNIRQIGGYHDIEPNLCEGSEDPDCSYLSRGELLVADPADPAAQVWAPMCAPSDPELRYTVADLACKQLVDWPYTTLYSVAGQPGAPFATPAEPEEGAKGVFRPSAYRAWVTVTGGDATGKVAVQQMELQVLATPCESGQLLSFQCRYADD